MLVKYHVRDIFHSYVINIGWLKLSHHIHIWIPQLKKFHNKDTVIMLRPIFSVLFWNRCVVNNKVFKVIIVNNELVPSLEEIRYLQEIKNIRWTKKYMQFPKQNDAMLITYNNRSCMLLEQIILPKEGIKEYEIAISNCDNENKPMTIFTDWEE